MKKRNVARPKFANTRKNLRKEKRKVKKQHRQEHYLRKTNVVKEGIVGPGKFVKRPENDPDQGPVKKKKEKSQSTVQDILFRQRQKEISEAQKLQAQMEKQRKEMFLKANEDEDKVIKKLEKQLGMNKTKNKNNFFADDGLDYLLEVCDRATSEQIVAAEKHLANVDKESDFEDDLAAVTGKEKKKDKTKELNTQNNDDTFDNEDMDSEDEMDDDNDVMEDESDLDDSDGDESDVSDVEEIPIKEKKHENVKVKKSGNEKKTKLNIVSEEDISKVFSEDEVSHISDDDDLEGDENSHENEDVGRISENQDKERSDVWEDIYGRKRDKEGNIIKEEKGIYIPPHLRNKDSTSDKELAQLKRQIKSVLNKLAATNLHWASTSIENLYANNSRNSVNTALTQLWLEAVVGPSMTPDRMVAEHAALVAVLHANVGSEIGAHFLEELSRKFDEMMRVPQPVEDKRLNNLVSCLAHLFGFKIYHASLLYDILGRLVEELTEKNIECVVTALRCVGGIIRKEEPTALRDFIHETQGRATKMTDAAAGGSRIKFLLEVLLAVKNNNLSKIPNYEPGHVEMLVKASRAVVRRGHYVTALNIRLEDLLKAHERGKWWVVGSAWEGARPAPGRPAAPPAPDQRLLQLARQQRMNTDVRRAIFCVLMSAEDYMDAYEKLQHLGLRGSQEREVAAVLLACCLREAAHNPYYGVLARRLCGADRKYQLSIQYSVWDKIKDLESLSKQSSTNLAQFLIHLIMEKSLPLSVLKIIQFSDLNKHTVRFMRQILLAIIMNADLQMSLEVFHRIAKPPKLHMFRESLRLFIQHFLIKNAGKKNSVLSDEELATLKTRAAEVDKILTMHETKLRL